MNPNSIALQFHNAVPLFHNFPTRRCHFADSPSTFFPRYDLHPLLRTSSNSIGGGIVGAKCAFREADSFDSDLAGNLDFKQAQVDDDRSEQGLRKCYFTSMGFLRMYWLRSSLTKEAEVMANGYLPKNLDSMFATIFKNLCNSKTPQEEVHRKNFDFLKVLKGANSVIPHVVLASTVLALVYPPSFTWFTNRYYAPALGFLMFAVGVNSSPEDFVQAIKRPEVIGAGYIGQFIIKPILGFLFGSLSVSTFGLPTSLGVGIMLVSCVSGAQLSNYATYLTDPPMAPLSIVMTSLSTATAAFVTPILSLLLIGKKLPVDVKGMMTSIVQIVVAPIAAGLLLNRFLPKVCTAIQPFLPPLSVFVTALCVGAPLSINIDALVSPFGVSLVLLIFMFHASAFLAGYGLSGLAFQKASDVKAIQRTISFETGMQSSLLALALANNFFRDPLVSVPPAISVVLMSLMGFSLVMLWSKKQQ